MLAHRCPRHGISARARADRQLRKVERIGITVGLADFTFIPAMLISHPDLHAFANGRVLV